MGESNGEWGDLVAYDTELAEQWDTLSRLPEPGENHQLDAFIERKNLDHSALVRLGAKLAAHDVLAFAGTKGIKYRDVVTGKRWTYIDSTWPEMKVIRHHTGSNPNAAVIVCEGETDGARLTMLYPGVDVAVMMAGARYFPESYAAQLTAYDAVYVGLDNDEAGDAGATQIMEKVPGSVRLRPDGNDWCETDVAVDLPQVEAPLPELVPAGQLLTLEVPEVASWFENDILPIGGVAVVHGWAKSFKSFMSFDMMSAIAQCEPWCCFEPMEEPAKVAIIQYEVPWAYYRKRIEQMVAGARNPELVRENLYSYMPLRRPQLTAGNAAQEERVLKSLVDAGISVVLVDPIRRATGAADLNSEHEVRVLLSFFQRMNDEGITVVFTHHDNKEGAKAGGGSMLSMTGSGAFAGDVDTGISVSLPKGDDLAMSTRRNLTFTLRNSPPIGMRGVEMTEDGVPAYSTTPFGPADEDADPTPGSIEPAI